MLQSFHHTLCPTVHCGRPLDAQQRERVRSDHLYSPAAAPQIDLQIRTRSDVRIGIYITLATDMHFCLRKDLFFSVIALADFVIIIIEFLTQTVTSLTIRTTRHSHIL
jgi:hypothetical protein